MLIKHVLNVRNYLKLVNFTESTTIINPEDITKPNDKSQLKNLTAKIVASVPSFFVNWSFNKNKTAHLNKELITNLTGNFNENYFNSTEIIKSNKNETTVFLNNEKLISSFTYVFNLEILATNDGFFFFSIMKEFNIIINDIPRNGNLYTFPFIGLNEVTNFLFSCKKWDDDITNKKDLVYKIMYEDLNNFTTTNQTYIDEFDREDLANIEVFNDKISKIAESMTVIKDWSKDNEAIYLFSFTDKKIKQKYFKISCFVKDSFNEINVYSVPIKIVENTQVNYNALIESLDKNNDLDSLDEISLKEILKRSFLFKSLTDSIKNNTLIIDDSLSVNRTIIKPNNLFLEVADATCSNDVCNNNGICFLRNSFISCRCNQAFNGRNCQINSKSYKILVNIHKKLYELYNINFDKGDAEDGYLIMYNLVYASTNYLRWEDRELLRHYDFKDILKNYSVKFGKTSVFANRNVILGIYDNLFNFGVSRLLPLKDVTNYDHFSIYDFKRPKVDENIENSINNEIKKNRLLNESFPLNQERDNILSDAYKLEYKVYFDDLLFDIQGPIKDIISNLNENNPFIEYHSNKDLNNRIFEVNNNLNSTTSNNIIYENFNFQFAFHKRNFDSMQYFSKNTEYYLPKFNAEECLNNFYDEFYPEKEMKLVLAILNFKSSPFIYEEKLYSNYTSTVFGLKFYDSTDNYNELKIEKCSKSGEESKNIKLYFPVDNIYMPRFINEWRNLMNPKSQITQEDSIFSDPIFIDENGNISNKTVSERINSYYVPVNFTCEYYSLVEEKFKSDGLNYTDFTDENYYECSSQHLTYFSVKYYFNSKVFTTNGRFFFIPKIQIFKNMNNFFVNYGIIIMAFLLIILIFHILAYFIYDIAFNNDNLISTIKEIVLKVNLPYLKEYNFNYGNKYEFIEVEAKEINNIIERSPNYIDNIINDEDNFFQTGHKVLKEMIEQRNERRKKENMKSIVNVGFSKLKINSEIDKHSEDIMSLDENKTIKNLNVSSNTEKNLCSNNNISMSKDSNNCDLLNNPSNIGNNKEFKVYKNDANYLNFLEDLDLNDIEKYRNEEGINDEKNMNNYIAGNNIKKDKKLKLGEVDVINDDNFINDIENKDEIINDKNNKDADKYPILNPNLSFENQLVEIVHSPLSTCEFFLRNLCKRHFFTSIVFKFCMIFGKFKRICILVAHLSLIALFNSLFIVIKSDLEINFTSLKIQTLLYAVMFSNISILISFLITLPLTLCFYIDKQTFRDMYSHIHKSSGIKLLSEWQNFQSNHEYCKLIFGYFSVFLIFIISLYFSFSSCAVYKYQQFTWLIMYVIAIIFDFIIYEFLMEFLIAILYSKRKENRNLLSICNRLNNLRNLRVLTF